MSKSDRMRKARPLFFKPRAQIHVAHLKHLHQVARVAFGAVADPEAKATLEDIVEDLSRVLLLSRRAGQ